MVQAVPELGRTRTVQPMTGSVFAFHADAGAIELLDTDSAETVLWRCS